MEFDKQTILEEIQKRGGDHQKAADELPERVDHEQHANLLTSSASSRTTS